ncbi:MAG TPA: NAD(P)H-binding protein, partial [Candidatus Hydrogenedentes bacterium]|nr:NAD(P)H-binding protein [Candidatus Hydrogenedentota bacterium]
MPQSPISVLVTGATGYVGGRLVGRLQTRGYRVRCMARDPKRLERRVAANVEIVRGDVSQPETLDA